MVSTRCVLVLALIGGTIACGTEDTKASAPTYAEPAPGWVALDVVTDVSPTAIEHGGKLHVFVRRPSDGKVYVASSQDGAAWSGARAVDGVRTDAPVAAVSFGGVLHAFARSSADAGVYHAEASGSEWSSWSRVSDITTDTALGASVFANRLYLFARRVEDHAIQWASSANGASWTPWSTRGDRTTRAPSATVVDGTIAYFFLGEGDGRIHYAFSADGKKWDSGEPLDAGVATDTGVTVGAFGRDLYVTVTDASTGHVFSNVTRAPIASPRWGGWFELPPFDRVTDVVVGSTTFGDGFHWFAKGHDDGLVYETSTPTYRLPFDSGAGWQLATGNFDDPIAGHLATGDYGFDFAHADDGVEVRAMRDGRVVLWEDEETCSFFEDWQCLDPDHCCSVINQDCIFEDHPRLGNLVAIEHDDGTVATYHHLAYHTVPEVLRACGARVQRGDVIGQVGHTGFVCGPAHVHAGVHSAWSNVNAECSWGGDGYPDLTGIDQTELSMPIYFSDANHGSWRPVVGDALAP